MGSNSTVPVLKVVGNLDLVLVVFVGRVLRRLSLVLLGSQLGNLFRLGIVAIGLKEANRKGSMWREDHQRSAHPQGASQFGTRDATGDSAVTCIPVPARVLGARARHPVQPSRSCSATLQARQASHAEIREQLWSQK